MRLIVDIETNGFLDQLTTIHCIVAYDLDSSTLYKFKPYEIDAGVALLEKADELIAHNGITFDVPAIQKLYPNFKPKKVVDTLVCSRLIWSNLQAQDFEHRDSKLPTRRYGSHALEAWGYRLGLNKGDYGKQDNAWDTFSDEMLEYCVQDVRVTSRLYTKILGAKYSQQALDLEHSVAELMWRQHQNGFVFDEDAAIKLYIDLAAQRSEIFEQLHDLFPAWVVNEGTNNPKRTIRYT